mgnify:CR=1 FL=1
MHVDSKGFHFLLTRMSYKGENKGEKKSYLYCWETPLKCEDSEDGNIRNSMEETQALLFWSETSFPRLLCRPKHQRSLLQSFPLPQLSLGFFLLNHTLAAFCFDSQPPFLFSVFQISPVTFLFTLFLFPSSPDSPLRLMSSFSIYPTSQTPKPLLVRWGWGARTGPLIQPSKGQAWPSFARCKKIAACMLRQFFFFFTKTTN